MSVTIYDVAREANVSMATVSRVVNGNPNVKPATRKKVLDVIERLQYRPNAVARGLASKKTTTVGVIIPDISQTFYAELVRGIEDIATMYRYNILLSNSDKNEEKELRLIETMLGKQVDGIVLMSENVTKAISHLMESSPVPIVLAGTIDEEHVHYSVNIDYKEAAKEAVQQLIDNGHKEIGFAAGSMASTINFSYKLEGYKQALVENNRTFRPELIFECAPTYDGGIKAFDHFQSLSNKPTAFFASNDEIAIGLIHRAQDQAILVPDEMEVISFENSKLAKMVRPELTSVALPLYDIGAVSMRLLTKLMNEEQVEMTEVILPYRMEQGRSTK